VLHRLEIAAGSGLEFNGAKIAAHFHSPMQRNLKIFYLFFTRHLFIKIKEAASFQIEPLSLFAV